MTTTASSTKHDAEGTAAPRRRFPWHILVFMAPAFIIYTMFMVYPLLDSMRLSLYTEAATGAGEVFTGFDNFQRLFTDELLSERFWGAIRNNFVFFGFLVSLRRHDAGIFDACVLLKAIAIGPEGLVR